MLSIVKIGRHFTKVITKQSRAFTTADKKTPKINFEELKYPSRVRAEPCIDKYPEPRKEPFEIDAKTIQLLERLSLVDLDSTAALATLQSSIQFGEKITHIDTEGVEPCYTVLEEQNLCMREDQVTEGNCRESILQNAAITDEDYFVSPPGNIPLDQEERSYNV